MNPLKTIFKTDKYIKVAQLSATTFNKPNWQLKLHIEDKYLTDEPTEDDISNRVQAVVGTAFHEYAENIMKEKDGVVVEETKVTYIEVDGKSYSVSGTVDLMHVSVHEDSLEWTLRDYKTKGSFQTIKLLEGDIEDVKMQLSVNRWIRQYIQISDIGYVDVIIVGDMSPKLKKLMIEKLGHSRRYFSLPIELYSVNDTEDIMRSKIRDALSAEVPDCPYWLAPYCDNDCSFRVTGCKPPKPISKF